MIAIGISSVPAYAWLVRGQVLSIKQKEYVEVAPTARQQCAYFGAAHSAQGGVAADRAGVARHGVRDLSTVALSFIGLGAQPPTPEWGMLLRQGRDFLRGQWWIATIPGLAIVITVFGFNLLGDGLRDVLDLRASR